MTPRDFCFWLAGILRMSKDDSPTDKLIREQLDEVIKRESLPRTNSVSTSGISFSSPNVPLSSDEPLTFRKQPEHGWAYCNNPTGDTISDR